VLEFRILGPLEVVEQGRPLGLGGPRQRGLLAILLLRRGEAVSSDRLIDELWGERPPATAAKTLQGYVSHLRKALGNGVLVTRGGGYLLDVTPDQVDADRFEAEVGEARRALATGDTARARELLNSALGLWRGEALADLAYEPFAQRDVARLEAERLGALEDRIDADLLLGHHREVVGELEGLVDLHPHRERLLRQLMLALYRCGRHADALDVYRRGRQTLQEELGLETGPELRALEQRILTHDKTLDPPPVARPPPRATERSRITRGRSLVVAGGALLLAAAIAAVAVVTLGGDGGTGLRAAPNSVAAIDTDTNHVVAQIGVGLRPSAIAYGSGSLWVANLDDQTVSRVDPSKLRTLRTLPVAAPPTDIAAVGGGVWVVSSAPTARFVSVSRIDPQFNAIGRAIRIGNVVPGSPAALEAREASLWVAPYSGLLTRLDSQTRRVVREVDPNAAPAGIGVGDDAVWLSDSGADNVTRVDSTGLVTSLAVGHGPSGIAVGEGGVWVAETGEDRLVHIDPSTRAVRATIPVGNAPTGVSLGAGSVWVANSGDGTVTRVDPGTDKPLATIAVGGSPQEIAVAGKRAWVTVAARTIPAAGLATRGGMARLDGRDDVDSMDPALAYIPPSVRLLYATCAKLLNYPDSAGPAALQLVPEVAESLPTRSADGKTYTFTIRDGFRFSPPSNEPVTAQTFKDTIERTLNPRMKSPVAGGFDDIVGARAYMAGKVAHIAGLTVRGNTLTVRLTAPAPNLPARLAQSFFCAVPSNTPIDPKGVREIPSAGPYRVLSYTPRQGVVLTRNPNYHGNRPHRLARIEEAVGVRGRRAIAEVERGAADVALDGAVDASNAARLAARYGKRSPAARNGRQQYFVSPLATLDFFALNTHRPLFSDVRLRRAVNYATDRAALARLGSVFSPLPEHPTDHYLMPGIPGYSDVHIYPARPDVARARQLARGRARTTAVLYTCDAAPCDQQAQILKTDLAKIGMRVKIRAFAVMTLFTKVTRPGEPFDISLTGWGSGYPDPADTLNLLLEGGTVIPTLNDRTYRVRLAAAAKLTGPERYLTYARLDADLARDAAPWIAYGNPSSHELFSGRMGCQVYGVYGLDLAALCVRKTTR
jgi:YVTN family beta-propeller protein